MSMQTTETDKQPALQTQQSSGQQTDKQQELAHLQECLDLISKNIAYYEEEAAMRKKETARLMKAMTGGDPELYNQAMTAASLEAHANNQLRKNKASLKQPYFGRIDYTEDDRVGMSKVYIGKNGVFRNKTDVVIADWRAPISTVYYENEMGRGCYYLPGGKPMEIDLKQKRTYDIQEGELKGYYDSDVAANDALLIQYLAQNKTAVLGDIIATIQKEQNEIIRQSPFGNVLVQGVAGSGKTTVAMHRISYLLYNYKERFMSNEFCIIGGNDLLLSYIASGLPELDIPDIKQKRMDVMLTHLLGKEWKKTKQKVIPPTKDAAVRSKMNFMLELEIYLMKLREKYVPTKEVKDPALGTLLTQSNNERLIGENPDLSATKLLMVLDERLRTRIKFLCPDGEKEYLSKKLKQYRDYYKDKAPKESIYGIYAEFLREYNELHPGLLDMAEHNANAGENKYDVYDVAALLMVQYRITRKKEDEEFGQIFIDEAQDFGMVVYYALKRVLPKCFFTIMGDVSQNINFETGMNDWEDMRKWMLTGEKDCFRLLSKSYRNTIEISEYAGKILERASFGRYKIDPVIRHGIPVQKKHGLSEDAMYDEVARVAAAAGEKGYETVAVICKDEQTADFVAKWMDEDIKVLPISLTKGLEFDVVVLWDLDPEAEVSRSQAKLFYVASTRALHELHVLCGD